MTDRATTAEPDLTELAPLVRVVTDALRETPLTLGTPAGIADLAATITVRVAAYVGREVLPPGPPADRAAEIEQLRAKYKAGLRRADATNNALMEEVQRYAAGTERPVLWSVYNEMHKRALNAEAEVDRLRRLAGGQQEPVAVAEQPVAGLTVDSLARLLAGATALTGDTPPYDQLPDADRERYLGEARQLLDRADGGQQP